MVPNNVSDIMVEKNLWYIRIRRKDGSSYRVVSTTREGIEDYRKEFIEFAKQKAR